jgi:hypothetical protein
VRLAFAARLASFFIVRARSWRVAAAAVFGLAATALVFGAPADLARGLAWLQAQVQADGNLPAGRTTSPQQARCEAATTLLKLAGSGPQVSSLLAALQPQGADEPTETLACWQQLRQQLGQNILDTNLDARRVGQQGYAAYEGFGVANALDTGWALAARLQTLSAADKASVLAWLQSAQAASGAFLTAGKPDMVATAVVVRALKDEVARNTAASGIATKAAAWLLAQRSAQGGWLGDVAVSSIVFEAVHPYSGTAPAVASEVEAWLLGQQQPDGSWQGDAYVTAVALRALALTSVVPVDPSVPPGAVVRGLVTAAANGSPLAGVTVSAQTSGASARTAVTDAEGAYQIQGLAAGNVTVSAALAGYQSATGQATVTAGSTVVFSPALYATGAVQPSGARIKGQVLAFGSNAPLAGASVQVAGATQAAAQADAQGTFDLSVNAGTHTVTYALSGYDSQVQQVVLPAGAVADVGAILLRAARSTSTLRGVVTDANGQVLPGAVVALQGLPPVTTNAGGAYAFDALTGTQFTATVSASGYATRSFSLGFTQAGDYVQDFSLPAASSAFLDLSGLALSPSVVGLRKDVTATAVISNPSQSTASAVATAVVSGPDGTRIATLAGTDAAGNALGTVTLAPGAQQPVRYKWNSGSFAPGSYTIVARLQEPGSMSSQNPEGTVLASQQQSLAITGGASIIGSVTANPPVLRAGTSTAVKLSALIQNDGNVVLPAQGYRLSVVDTKTGQATLTQTVSAEELPQGQLRTLNFSDWTPQAGGNFRLELTAPSTPGPVITTTLYVGDSGSAQFAVDRSFVPAGDQKVRGTVTVTGQSVADGTINDPLVPLVKAAIVKAVNYADNYAYNHFLNDLRCYACHVQTQSVVGGERSLRYTQPLQPLQRTTALNVVLQNIRSDGSIYSEGYPMTGNTLGLWAGTQWRDPQAVLTGNRRMAEYVMSRQQSNGSWPADHPYAWWRTQAPVTALNVGSLSALKQQIQANGVGNYTTLTQASITGVPGGDMRLSAAKDGTLYIAHRTNGQLYRVAPGATAATLVATLPITSALPLDDGRVLVTSRSGIWMRGTDGTMIRINTMDSWDVISDGAGQFLVSPYGGSAIFRMTEAGATTQLFASSVLASNSGSMVLLADGMLAISTYNQARVQRFTLSGQLLDYPIPLTTGQPIEIRPYKDGMLVATEAGLYAYDKNWVAERLLFERTGGQVQMPDGRFFVAVRNGIFQLSLAPPQPTAAGTTLVGEGGNFTLHVPATIRYGAGTRFVDKSFTVGTHGCNNSTFGDPAPGTSKSCWTVAGLPAPGASSFTAAIDDAVAKAESWLVAGSGIDNNNNIDVSFRLIGLGKLKEHYKGTTKENAFDTLMQTVGGTLRSRQRTDGGWSWTQNHSTSDSMVTAMAGLALDNLNPSKDSPEVRNAIQLLLNRQKADGTWATENGIVAASASLIPSTWVEIWLPTMLERLGGIDTDLNISLAPNVALSNPSTTPTAHVTAADGSSSVTWRLTGVTETSRQIGFDLTLQGMQVDETRPVAQQAQLVFKNSFVDGSVTMAIEVPKVSVGTTLVPAVRTDKPSYTEAEQALFTATATNGGTAARDATVRFTVLDAQGAVVNVLPLGPAISVPGAGTASTASPWAAAGVLSGNYTLRVELLSPVGLVYGSATTSFVVTASQAQATGARITADRVSYSAAQTVQLASRVTNTTSNAVLNDVQARTEVKSAGGQVVFSRTESVAQIAPQGARDWGYSLAASGLAAGSYGASLQLLNASGTVLAASTTTFSVLGAEQTGVGLTGQLQANPAAVLIGQGLQLTLQATNGSTAHLAGVPLAVRIIEPVSASVLATFTATVADWAAGSTQQFAFSWPVAIGSDGQVLVAAATAAVGGGDVTLAQANIRLVGVPMLQGTPTQLTYAPIFAGENASQQVVVSSVGTTTATAVVLSLAGTDASQFVIPSGGCTQQTALAMGATCTFTVSYRPTDAGSHTAQVRIAYAGGDDVVIQLAGQAKPVVMQGTVAADPAEVTLGQPATLSYTVSNPSTATGSAQVTLSLRDPAGATVASWPVAVNDLAGGATLAGSQSYTPSGVPQTLTVVLSQSVPALGSGTATTSVLATSTLTVTPVPVKLSGVPQRKAEARVLVLASCPQSEAALDIDDPNPSLDEIEQGAAQPDILGCEAQRGQAISAYLTQLGVAHKVVTTAARFQEEMRCGTWNTYWLSGGGAKLDRWLVRELREAVWRGEGLVIDGEHDARNHLLHPVAGVKYRGKLPTENQTAAIGTGSMFAAGPLGTLGQVARFELLTGQSQGLFTTVPGNQGAVPAIVASRYGAGHSMLFAFNLAAMLAADPQAADARLKEVVTASLARVGSNLATVTAGDAALFGVNLVNQGNRAGSARVVATLPAGIGYLGSNVEPSAVAGDGVTGGTTGGTVTWTLTLAAGATQELTLRVRTDRTGEFTIPVAVHSLFEGSGGTQTRLNETVTLTLGVTAANGLVQAPTAAVNAVVATTSSDLAAKDKAARAVTAAQQAYAQGQYQQALVQWETAVDALISIAGADTNAARTAVAWALEATQDGLCQVMACLAGSLSVNPTTPLGSVLGVTGVASNSCQAQVAGTALAALITNSASGQAVYSGSANLDLPPGQSRSAQLSWQPLEGQAQLGDWLETVLNVQWQGQTKLVGTALTQVTSQASACHPGWSLAPARFAAFAGEGVTAKGGRSGNSDWEWALGTSASLATADISWVSGKTYGWTLTVNAAGQGTLTVTDGTTQMAQVNYASGANKLRVGNALRLAVSAASDVGGATLSGAVTQINGQAVTMALATTGAGQDKQAIVYLPAQAQGLSASGTVRMDYTGNSPPVGTRLSMTVQSGQASCQ